MTRTLLRHRRVLVVVVHAGLVALSNYLAFWLRFDGAIPDAYRAAWLETVPWLIAIRTLVFFAFHLHEGVWQYVGLRDLRAILTAVVASSAVFFVLVYAAFGLSAYPRTVFVVDALLLVLLMGALGLSGRLFRSSRPAARIRRVLIYGAGDAGEMMVREIVDGGEHGYRAIGFVDDDPAKVGGRIHGVPVLGTRLDLARVIGQAKPDELLVAIPRATPRTLRAVVKALEPYKLPIKALPNVRDILDGRVTLSDVRDLAVADLLGRTPVGLDAGRIRDLIAGKRVLVTGAGGSIGSEISRQVARLAPSRVVLLERYENALWAVERSLAGLATGVPVYPVIADITDEGRVDEVLRAHQPELIIHAAAHKHVPLMELNPCEAIKNNVKGTRIVGEAAVRHGVKRFVLISSDKAVNPSSVMGATKRVAELLVMALAEQGPTGFVVVRFGNVMGSNGSVIPLFLEQIKDGGPVTVTHPEMRRYFMLIPEAVQLVLQAASLDENGALYVLDMGDEIKVVDMARNLIRLSGFIPEREIPIVYTGMRPGEKLSEELVASDETIEPSRLEGIRRVRSTGEPPAASLGRRVADLEGVAEKGAADAVMHLLAAMVPMFRPVLPVGPEIANGRPVLSVDVAAPAAAAVGEAGWRRVMGGAPARPPGWPGRPKRVFDLVVASVALVALAPLLGVVALAIRLSLGRPVIFAQRRPGRHARPFILYKFRTLSAARGADGRLLPDRDRLTRLGRLLRRTSIDELPELINVIRGDMSLVGPRPLLMEYIPLYTKEQARRHDVRPGITGWAQLNGRNTLMWEHRFALDVWYVEQQSFRLDLWILLLTVWKALVQAGVSQPGEGTEEQFRGGETTADGLAPEIEVAR